MGLLCRNGRRVFEGSAARVRYAQAAYSSMRMQGRLCVSARRWVDRLYRLSA